MTLKYSAGALNFLAGGGSYRDMFDNGRVEIYSGAQPANANAAVTGTLLCTITNNALARTAEVLSAGTLTLTGGASGSVNTLTVNGVDILGGAVNFDTTLTQTASDIATQINNLKGNVRYLASFAGAVVTITALPGTGASPNAFVVAATYTTITGTTANLAGGVAAVNGLLYTGPVGGVVNKLAAQTWSGTNGNTGTAGWFRAYGSVADAGALDSVAAFLREDGAIATAGAEMNMVSTSLAATALTVITGWQRTISTL